VVDTWELFDLENDPHEMKNLYSDPDYSLEIKELKLRLAQLQLSYKVPED
jgi:hypothetical protein